MPKNSFSGNRIVSARVHAAAAYEWAPNVGPAVCTAIPGGGTALTLPDDPSDGDWYVWCNPDNSASVGDPITLGLSARAIAEGVTIQGATSQVFSTAGTSGRASFDDASSSWWVSSAQFNARGSGGAGGVLATRTDKSGALGPLQTLTFDSATPYVPLTTGSALLIVNAHAVASTQGDPVEVNARVGGGNLPDVKGNANSNVGDDTAAGGLSTVIPIVAGTPLASIGVQAGTIAGQTLTCLLNGLQVTIIELQGSGAEVFPGRVRAAVVAAPFAAPVADGAGAVLLTLPALVVPIGAKVNISGVLRLKNTAGALRAAQVFVEIAGAAGVPVGDSGMEVEIAVAGVDAVGYSVDFTTTTASTTFTVNVYCPTGGAAPGDIAADSGTACTATATQVG